MSSPPWLDLPDHLTEKILEGLPLSDYVRFPAVCRRWRSIQIDHRLRHAPLPPPMRILPWSISFRQLGEEIFSCYSPFEDRSYRIRLPSPTEGSYTILSPFVNGWLNREDAIINPVSGVQIPFPEPSNLGVLDVISVLPPPDFTVFAVTYVDDMPHLLFFQPPSDRHWTRLRLPLDEDAVVTSAVALRGKFYCISNSPDPLIVLDTLTEPPTVRSYSMADGQRKTGYSLLAESDGELLLIRRTYSSSTFGFEVAKADLSNRVWTRMASLGDRLLIITDEGRLLTAVSLLAADVGFKKNCIYFSTRLAHDDCSFSVFDLDTGTEMEAPSLLESLGLRIFVPSIC